MRDAKPALLVLLAALGSAACRGSAPAPPPEAAGGPAEAPRPAPGSWAAELEAVAAKGLAMPSPPLAYSYHQGDDPEHLSENVANAARFIAVSLAYQRAAQAVPSSRWTAADRSAYEQNKRHCEGARRVLREDSRLLLRSAP